MKAALIREPRDIIYADLPMPQPAAGEVLVKVHYTGICGSDVPRANAGTAHSYPLVVGHEFMGTVESVGNGVDPSIVGKRVSGIPLEPCMECADCAAGNFSLCKHYGFVGSRSQGSMAEYVKLRYENLYFLGDGVSDLEGAFFEPASVAVHGIELAGFEQGKSAIVIGAGTIGILLAQALTGYGASVVVVSNRSVERLEAARDAGLEKLVNSSDEGWVDDACTFNGGARFDYVFDTAGTPQTILDAFDVAGNKGVVCFVGTPKREVTFTVRQWEMLNRKELTVTGSWMSYSAPWPGVEWDIVNRFFDDGTMKIVPAMVDTIYPLEETAQAFARFADGPKVRGKIVIDSRKESN